MTADSFAADLAANDSLRSGLFTLCNAISHMGETDLSPEELLTLVARAIGGPGSAEGESGSEIPASMREAFLTGYAAWQNRLAPAIDSMETGDWPPAARNERGSPMLMDHAAPDSPVHPSIAGSAEPAISSPGRRTVQEALSLVSREQGPDSSTTRGLLAGANGEDLGAMTLAELKSFLEDIEHRVSRLGPHLDQLTSTFRSAAGASHKERSEGDIIPFPGPRKTQDPSATGDFNLDSFTHSQPGPADPLAVARVDDAFVASHAKAPDERPRGIDALVAAAPAWANASPTARAFDEDSFLARHAYLSPSRRPGTNAQPSLYFVETPAHPQPPLLTGLQPQIVAPVLTAPVLTMTAPTLPVTVQAPPLIGLDEDEDPLVSPMERLRATILRLSPRKVFAVLAGLTIFAGCLAGIIAYHTLHSGAVPQFKDIQPPVRFGTLSMPTPAADEAIQQSNTPATSNVPVAAKPVTAPLAAPAIPRPSLHLPQSWRLHSAAPHVTPAAVWPPVPQPAGRESTPQAQQPPVTVHTVTPSKSATTPAASDTAPLYVPAPTMIGYALSSPQPIYPTALAHGIAGTVAVEVVISRLGDVTSAHAVSGPAELRAAAVAAVHGWHFRPYVAEDGRAATVETTLQFYFKGN
ncbi:MAG TPA: TonB family protein [Acidobacteriaceae bacterium]|nr:TonB family protein [Acidobacteriaceae bacterium]